MASITVIGSNMMDLNTYVKRMPLLGETFVGESFAIGFGGKGANQAIAISRLGTPVHLITMVGNDNFGQQQLDNYEQNHISLKGVGVGHQSNGVASIFVDENAENSIVIVKGANMELTPEFLEEKVDLIQTADLLVLQQEIALETNYRAIDLANQYDVPVLLNPAPANKDLDLAYVAKVDYFTPNETELAALTGMPTDSIESIEEAGRSLIAKGVKNLLVTLGSKGVLYLSDKDSVLVPAMKVEAVDSTGAGDAFIGSFAHYLVNGANIPETIQKANRYAAVTVTRRGTQKSYPTEKEFQDILKEWKD